MILRPVDFSLLQELSKGRNVGGNLHIMLDVSRQYVNERLGVLADYGLVTRIGPNENVGLYEITQKGEVVLKSKDKYDSVEDFDTFVEDQLGN